MKTIEASLPCLAPPAWAIYERALFQIMDQAVYPYLRKYTHDDGRLIWGSELKSRDGADDFYESFYNFPLLYLLGGGDHLLKIADREWDAITRQLTELGMVYNEYERGYDQFHQSESYIYFYLLCLADPHNPKLVERARRFAGLYLNEDPNAPNYDPQHRIIRAPHNGSGGPRWGFTDSQPPRYSWSATMERYGLPYSDVPGINSYADLKDPELAQRMGAVMQERMGKGDVATNLCVVSLITNAYLLTGDEKYKRWVLEYVDAWLERAEQNGGLLPDNVGLSGKVGEYMNGKWYGGLYGWTWPHGFYNIGMAAIVAGSCAYLLSNDKRYLDLARTQMDRIIELGIMADPRKLEMSLQAHWVGQISAMEGEDATFVVPYRYGDEGWFDYQPMSPVYPTALWNLTHATSDWQRIEQIRTRSREDWSQVTPFRNKEDCGHEQPWLRFLAGDNPGYPEAILSASYGTVCRRLALIREDNADLTKVYIHHWQQLNPVVTEALVQLTLGSPQIIYNGGLPFANLRYFDAERQRPGLPQDVAALVDKVEEQHIRVHLVNTSPLSTRTVQIQAGAFGEHRFKSAAYQVRTSEYPGKQTAYAAPPLETRQERQAIDSTQFQVLIPPASEITLELDIERFVNQSSY